jgi:DNA-binding GntR family transcriptional regulator
MRNGESKREPWADLTAVDLPLALQRRPPRQSLVDLAYEAIVEAIVDRRIGSGARIGIDALAERLGMSATPVREALARASAKGLVVQESNRGVTVAPLLSPEEYGDLWDTRRLIELHALDEARLEPAAVERLGAIIAGMPSMEHGPVYRGFREFSEADHEFHHTLVSMAGNEFLMRAWDDLHFHLHAGRLYAGPGLVDFHDALREHGAIVALLRAGDKTAARSALAGHIDGARRRLAPLIEQSRSASA